MGDSGYTTTPSALHQGDFIADDVVYKLTSNSEIVVARHVSLHSTKFYTYQDQEHDRERKSWILDRRCQLVPRFAHEIDKAVPKTIRPKRTWTITATVNGKGEPIMLYMFQLTWPRGWAAKGYTSFMFGFKTLADARRWHDNFSRVIDKLRDKHGRGGHAADLYTTSVTPSGTRHQHDINLEKESTHSHYESGQRTPMSVDTNAGDPFSGVPSSPTKYYDALAPANVSLFATPMLEPTHTEDHHDRSTLQQSTTNDDSSEDEEEATHRHNRAQSLKERWIPYKQVNGLSVYYHHHDGDNQSGGEYMVSAVVHGSPRRVLDVLMHGSANTTILGPARKVDILEVTKINENTTKELVRLTIEAPGWAGLFCAPREIVVERMCKSDPNRSYVVMFNSSDDVELRSRAYCSKNSQGIVSPMSPTNGINGEQCSIQTQEEAMGQRTRRSIWRTAVQGSVSGCYTISCLNHMTLANSRESLITCMVKVDLKGACASDTYIGALCDVFGWREAFLDRVLMNVMLVRDEVEHRRFKVQPQDMMSAQPLATPLESSGPKGSMRSQVELNGTPGGAAMGRPGFINRSMTMALGPDYIVKGTVPPISIMRSNINVPPNLATSSRMINQEESQPPAYEPAAEDTHAAETGHAILDYAIMEKLSTLPKKYWSGIHTEGTDAPYSVRGPTYLKDRKKVKAGLVQFAFSAMDLIVVPGVTQHVARFLPSVRNSGMPFGIIINLIIPGTPMLNVVATFATEQHPGKVLCNPPSDPMDDGHNWQPFDFAMHKFYYGSDETRNKMLKLIPHIADGSWMIKSSVGTVPVILGKALKTTYHVTPQYIEIDIDISANSVANYVTGLVRGATKSLVIDMGFVLEGTTPWELPENLLGAIRLNHLDIKEAVKIDVSRELPLVPPRYKHDPDMTGTEPPTPTGMSTPVIPEHAPASNLAGPSAFDGPAAAQAMNSPGPKVKIPPTGAYVPGPATGPASTGRPAGTPMGTLQPSSSGNLGGATAFGARHRHTRTGSNIDPALLSNLAGDRHQGQAPPSPR